MRKHELEDLLVSQGVRSTGTVDRVFLRGGSFVFEGGDLAAWEDGGRVPCDSVMAVRGTGRVSLRIMRGGLCVGWIWA